MIETKSTLKSNFVGLLGIKNHNNVKKNLIDPIVKKFFDAQDTKISEPQEIDAKYIFSDMDFLNKSKPFLNEYFYQFISENIYKENGQIKVSVTYCITLDKQNCSKNCEKTGMLYDEILLYNQPVFYFIYVDIEEIFSFLRN
jgi:hypothetical protein